MRPEQSLLNGQLNFLRYFTLPPGSQPTVQAHYNPSRLLKWLYPRAIDYRPILYSYFDEQGNPTPIRVRLVSTLDRLELVLIHVDFTLSQLANNAVVTGLADIGTLIGGASPYKNLALDFLTKYSRAFGDLDPALFPEEIRAQFQGARPPTLLEATTILSIDKAAG